MHIFPRVPCGSLPDVRTNSDETYDGTLLPCATWHPRDKDPIALTRGQYETYLLLQQAGDKQLLTFMSGEGGVGKSTVIALLIAYWRSQGLRVIVQG